MLDLFVVLHCLHTCERALEGGVWACPDGVVVEPRTPCTPELIGRLDGGTKVVPGGGEQVPGGGEDVPVFWLVSTDTEEVLWSLKSERSFISKVWMSSLPADLDWTSAPSDSTGCDWIWVWLGNEVGGWGWEWMDEFTGWEDVPAPLKACCSEAPTLLDVPEETVLLFGWGPGTEGTVVSVDGGETVEDEEGMVVDGGTCGWAISFEVWGGGLESLTPVWDWAETGEGETLPAEMGGDDVAVDVTETGWEAVLVVETTASGGDGILLEFGQTSVDGPVDGTVDDSGSVVAGSRVLLRSTRACLTSMKACWRLSDGAERERPNGAKKKSWWFYSIM